MEPGYISAMVKAVQKNEDYGMVAANCIRNQRMIPH